MSTPWKPAGYNSASPYLIVDRAAETLEFLRVVFGGVQLQRYENGKGGVMHAEIRIDDTVLMLADAQPQWPAAPAHVHIYVSDVDDAYRRALEAGATSVQEPVKKQDADKRAGVSAGGTTWWIATRIV